MKAGNNKRTRTESVVAPEPRSVALRTDNASLRVVEFAEFIKTVISERDSALSEVEELNSRLEDMAHDKDRIVVLEKDVEYWREDREAQKTAKDNFDMDLRRANEEINVLKSACVKVGKEAENLKKILKSRDVHAEKLEQEITGLKHNASGVAAELARRDSVAADMNASIIAQTAAYQELLETANTASAENERLTAELLANKQIVSSLTDSSGECETLRDELQSSRRRCEILEQGLTDGERELEALNATRQSESTKLRQLDKVVDDIHFLFHDAILTVPDGTGYLLGSGKMLSLDSIARLWIRDPKFNGEPTYHLKCAQSDTVTTVIHSPAVCKFVRSVAAISALHATPELHFRYSEKPSTDPAVGWRTYGPYEQLTLIAKLIHMYSLDQAACSFQAMIMENHIVTATCTRDFATRTARVKIALNVTTKQGIAHQHRIELVDNTFFPASFEIDND